MNLVNVKKYVIVGLKVLTFIASGISAYLGIKEILPHHSPDVESSDEEEIEERVVSNIPREQKESDVIIGESGLSQKGQKIIGILGIISSVCLGIFEVVKSLGTVTDSVDRLFRRKNYTPVVGRGGYIPGNYPWNNPEQRGYPNNAPIYRGQDGKQDGIYWIQREEGITEVW